MTLVKSLYSGDPDMIGYNVDVIGLRGEIQMIPESAYKLSASKNWEILWKNKL